MNTRLGNIWPLISHELLTSVPKYLAILLYSLKNICIDFKTECFILLTGVGSEEVGEKNLNGGSWSLGRMDRRPETPFSLLWLCLHVKMFTYKFPWELQIQFKGHHYRICFSNLLCNPQKTRIILELSLKSVCSPEDLVNQHMAFQQAQTSYVCSVDL